MILEVMKKLAETYLGTKISKAVITVPAHFNDAQRQATKDAGRIAGLDVMRIINEPTAAALAYGLHNKYEEMSGSHSILIYDFGGGTFDVSVITIENGVFEVKATDGEAYLGGDDLDINITNHFVKEFQQKYKINLHNNKRAIRRLRYQCEKLKKTLSYTETANIDIDVIYSEGGRNYDLSSTLTRTKFEQINSAIFTKTLDCVKSALKGAKFRKDQIDEVVLIGGSSRIPRVRDLVRKFFNKELNASLNPDEAVARGAAIQAAIMSDTEDNTNLSLLLYDVSPLSLGIETIGGEMSVIIPRNTQIPTRRTEIYETSEHNATNMRITVYEGERALVHHNRKLGEFTISGIPPRPRGEVEFEVSFEMNVDGILNVAATQIDGGTARELEIDSQKGHLTEEEVQRMVREAERHREEDERAKEVIRGKVALQVCLEDLRDGLADLDLEEDDKEVCRLKYDEVVEWMDGGEVTVEGCEIKKNEFEETVMAIFRKYN